MNHCGPELTTSKLGSDGSLVIILQISCSDDLFTNHLINDTCSVYTINYLSPLLLILYCYIITLTFVETSLFVVYGDRLILNGMLDREKQNHYQFQVFSKDNGNPPCHVSSTMEIHVEDVNDNPPVFYNTEDKVISTSTATILEKSPVGSPILLPNVTDIDIDENAEIKFTLQADKPDILNYFKINSKTGVVTIAAQVDLNSLNRLHISEKNATKTASLEMSVVATDSGVPPLSSNLTLTVVVEGINDQAPVFLLPEYNLTISENIPIGELSVIKHCHLIY
jgi:protocadherin-16/23